MITTLDIQNQIEAMLPSSTDFSFAQRAKFIDDVLRRIYKDVGLEKVTDFRMTTVMQHIDLTTVSTQIRIDNVRAIYVTSTQTTATSNAKSTQDWDEYKVGEIRDFKTPNTICFPSYFPDERVMRVRYLAIPALSPATSSDSSTIPDIDQEAVMAVEYGTLSRILKSGSAPDVQLANAYEADFNQEMRRMKTEIRNRKRKTGTTVSYREWEW